jgi:hypothetical protein
MMSLEQHNGFAGLAILASTGSSDCGCSSPARRHTEADRAFPNVPDELALAVRVVAYDWCHLVGEDLDFEEGAPQRSQSFKEAADPQSKAGEMRIRVEASRVK